MPYVQGLHLFHTGTNKNYKLDKNMEAEKLDHKLEPEPAKENTVKSDATADDDLDALLDDALEDFDKPLKKRSVKDEACSSTDRVGDTEPPLNAMLDDDALLKMTEGWDEVLQEMAKDDPNMLSEFQKFQETFKAGMAANTGEDGTFNENMAKTLEDLSKNLDSLEMGDQMAGFEEMMKEMENMSGDGPLKDGDAFMGMMQGMMENLLSKDLLYPSLKEIKEKYPSWLEKNSSKLKSEELGRYKHQEEIVCNLCKLFEEESEEDSDSVKKERSGKIVELMQKMQIYGQPPTDMMNEIAAESGAEGYPAQAPPPLPTDCRMM